MSEFLKTIPLPIYKQMTHKTTGDNLTSGVSVDVVYDSGTKAAGAGTLTHKGDGMWEYYSSSTEANSNSCAIQFKHADAVYDTIAYYGTTKRLRDLQDFNNSTETVNVYDIQAAALAKFVVTNTGETTAATGSVAKLSQGAGSGGGGNDPRIISLGSRKQSSTSYPLSFTMVSASDGVTRLTGLSPTVTLSKNAGTFGAIAGTVTELSNGYYVISANSTDRSTLGLSAYYCTATGAIPVEINVNIVADDEFARPTETRSALGLASANLDTQIAALPTAAEIETEILTASNSTYSGTSGTIGYNIANSGTVQDIVDGVLDEAIAGHVTSGTVGQKINSAASAGDPWGTNLSAGSYTSGTAGKIILDNIDFKLSDVPTANENRDAILGATSASYVASGSVGLKLSQIDTTANTATAVWSKDITGITTTGTAAKILQDAEAGSSNIAQIGGVTMQAYKVVPAMGYNPQGDVAQIALTLVDQGGKKVSPTTLHASPTCSVTVREHRSGTNLFTTTGTSSNVVDGVFELEQSAPNFTDNVLYEIDATVTANAIAYRGTEVVPVMGA
jgi:hypothetical protein